jgi:ubiquinol-cytochrome c reductase cytochrome c1 subunit
MINIKKISTFFAAFCAAGIASISSVAYAAGGGANLNVSPHEPRDAASLQRGAQLFVNYCQGCHTAQYMRYNRLVDIGLTEKQITDNLILDKSKKIGDTMTNSMKPSDAKAWFGAVPPDLSLITRSYGTDRLYSYLRGFYRDDSRLTGWNNIVSPNIGMPHVLADLSGTYALKTQTFDDHGAAGKVASLDKGLWRMEDTAKGADGKAKTILSSVQPDVAGKLNPQQYDAAIADLVNFLAYTAEPYARDRKAIGVWMMIFLGFLAFLAYWLKSEYWKDVH